MENAELKALQTVKNEYEKVLKRYEKKANKEREKVNNIYVIVCGEKCYTEEEVNEWFLYDYITDRQAERAIEKLQKKKGQSNSLTKSEMVCKIMNTIMKNLTLEIKDIEIRQEQEQKKQERWKIAKEKGMSYEEFLEEFLNEEIRCEE